MKPCWANQKPRSAPQTLMPDSIRRGRMLKPKETNAEITGDALMIEMLAFPHPESSFGGVSDILSLLVSAMNGASQGAGRRGRAPVAEGGVVGLPAPRPRNERKAPGSGDRAGVPGPRRARAISGRQIAAWMALATSSISAMASTWASFPAAAQWTIRGAGSA